MGGIHPTYMYREVLGEAPWIDFIIRGEGEEISVNLMHAIAAGKHHQDRESILGLAYLDDNGDVVATPAHPPIRGPQHPDPRLDSAGLGQIHLHSPRGAGCGAQLRSGLPLPLSLLLPVEVLA